MKKKQNEKRRWPQKRVRVEDEKRGMLVTVKTALDKMWFVNNPELSWKIVGYLAKYQERYGVILYSFSLMGNHYHLSAKFPKGNKVDFMRSFNSSIQLLVKNHVKEFPGGQLIARGYDSPVHLYDKDIEHWAFYIWANPVTTGLVSDISQYNLYNSFFDAAKGREREFRVVNWGEYRSRVRSNKKLTPEDFTETYTLKFSRLPGYEDLSQQAYEKMMVEKLRAREKEALKSFKELGHTVGNAKTLTNVAVGSRPKNPKRRKRHSHRPVVLTLSDEGRADYLSWYFNMLRAYQAASKRYRAGGLTVEFPQGTYRPMVLLN